MLSLCELHLTSLYSASTCKVMLPSGCKAACRSGKDKLLHDLLSMDILPQLVESAAARRRAEEKQAAIEAMPKKRSSRLQVHLVLPFPAACQHAPLLSLAVTGKPAW